MLGEADKGFLFDAPENVIAKFQFPTINGYEALKEAIGGTSVRYSSLNLKLNTIKGII